ncbi:MAG: helix-turn-helix domain-containing protein [Ruminococcus sp.]|nr:helix-turn-helix domain-containing protein [Ruminococcus sp.]
MSEKKRGRKSLYERKILLNKKNIKSMLEQGATEKQIIKWLDISSDTFYRWKKQYSELSDICKEGKQQLISNLRGKLVERALGGQYTDVKTITKIVDGKEQKETIEIKKTVLPDVAAINLCLKNYDKENWSENPQNLELKKQELQLKKTIAEANSFDIDLEKM